MTDKTYKALGQNIFVRELKQEEKVNGFVMPDSLESDFTKGTVVYSSNGYYDHGVFINSPVNVGDIVLFPKISGTKVTLGGEKLIRVYMSDLVAIENETTLN